MAVVDRGVPLHTEHYNGVNINTNDMKLFFFPNPICLSIGDITESVFVFLAF